MLGTKKTAALREFEETVERATELARRAQQMRADIGRLEERQAKFAALGKRHVEWPASTYDQRYGTTIEWEPLKSKKNGLELAAAMDTEIGSLRASVEAAEAEAKELIAGSGEKAAAEIRRVLEEAGVAA
jgi:hypothetical protein